MYETSQSIRPKWPVLGNVMLIGSASMEKPVSEESALPALMAR